jgi:thiol-disulfide isomerase/thioredoxin
MKKDIFIVSIFLALAILAISCSSSNDSNSGTTSRVAQGQVQAASNDALNLRDVDGNPWNFNEYKGKGPLIINFWGSWCPPCRREMPDLKRIYEEYNPKGLEIIGIAVNDTPGKVKAYAQQNDIHWVLLMNNRAATRYFRLGAGVPTTIFLDRDGNETGRYVGMRTYNDFKSAVEEII